MPSKKSAAKAKAATVEKLTTEEKQAVRPADGPRRITPASYVSRLRRTRAARKLARNKLPNSFKILFRSIRIMAKHWEVFGGVLLIYAVINLVLIGGFSSGASLEDTKNSLADAFTGNFSKLSTGLTLFSFLVSSGTSVASGAASAYQTVVLIVVSLAIIWALRQFYSGNRIRIRDAFYNSTYPVVQVLLLLAIIGFQMLPAVLGGFLYNSLVVNGILTVPWQQVLCGVAVFLLVVWTLYMLIASVFAIYIVTLPGETPLAALRSAKEIVRHRRGTVFLKLVFLPIAMLVGAALVMVPLAVFATTAATIVYFVLTMLSVPIVHSYMYTLYRELIAE